MKKLIFGMTLLGALNQAALAAGSDELWEVTSSTEMKGVAMSVPTTTVRICMPKGTMSDPQRAMANENRDSKCKFMDMETSGNKITWNMRCDPPNDVNSTGEMTFSEDSYHQVVKTVSNMGGHKMEMNQVVDGKRVGTCQAKK